MLVKHAYYIICKFRGRKYINLFLNVIRRLSSSIFSKVGTQQYTHNTILGSEIQEDYIDQTFVIKPL